MLSTISSSVTISQWLGHASVTTTHRYATVDLDMKRQALAKARPTARATAGPALWRTDASVLEWLEALLKHSEGDR